MIRLLEEDGRMNHARLHSWIAIVIFVGDASPVFAQQQLQTTSLSTSNSLNQLPFFENTPNTQAAGEAQVSAGFRLLDFGKPEDHLKQYQFTVQGQYSFTNQLLVGGQWGVEHDDRDETKNSVGQIVSGGSSTGVNDLIVYTQYKLDQFISHDIIDLTAQLDVILPLGKASEERGLGHFGVRPVILAFKDFPAGPGTIGAYGFLGTTLTTHVDVIFGGAATYEWKKIVGILEFDDQAGEKQGEPLVVLTPGVAYRGIEPWEFEIGVPFGLNDASPDWGFIAKATWAFQK
jgi:hypothetical protein